MTTLNDDSSILKNHCAVSRETEERLILYVALLRKWQMRINLISPSTLPHIWRRHILDSAQLYALLPDSVRVGLDFGSGAGFPGLVLAILGVPDMHLVESDSRKVAFLREASRVTGASITLHECRIEAVPPFFADVITARALASLPELLAFSLPFLGKTSHCLFLKGKTVADELTEAARYWTMEINHVPSVTDREGVILQLSKIRRRDTPLVTHHDRFA
ncbi:Ribosomal RNA small subunit methyltransferase G [Azospirillaceae bacterium]